MLVTALKQGLKSPVFSTDWGGNMQASAIDAAGAGRPSDGHAA